MTEMSQRRPRRTPADRIETGPGGAVVQPPSAPPVALNPTALALWELCDGDTRVAEMVGAVASLFGIDTATATVDVERALEDMMATGVIR